MEKLSPKKKLNMVRQYLSGLSHDEIAASNRVSKGSVANTVSDLKEGRVPEAAGVAEHIEMLRELSLDLKRSNLTPGQCATGLTVLNRINEYGLDPADIDRWPLILQPVSSENEANELISTIYSIEEARKKTGLSLDELDNKVNELEKKAADLEPMSRQCEEYERQVTELTRQRKDLVSVVANLEEKYKFLNPRVKDLEKREQTLLRHVEEMEERAEKAEASLATLGKERRELLQAGLPVEALAEFSQKIQSVARRRSIPPEELRHRLLQELEQLDQAVGLEALIQSRRSELEKEEQAVARANQERESLKAVVSGLKQEKASLEVGIKETREKVSREISGIIPVAKDTVNQFAQGNRYASNGLGKESSHEDCRIPHARDRRFVTGSTYLKTALTLSYPRELPWTTIQLAAQLSG